MFLLFFKETFCVTKRFPIFVTEWLHKNAVPTMRRDVFQAIADPTRREIINLLANKNMNLNTVAENFDISRPAISKHIKMLTECGLIVIKQSGRERHCEVKLKKLNEVSDWVEQYRKFWDSKLDALELYLDKIQKNKKNVRKK